MKEQLFTIKGKTGVLKTNFVKIEEDYSKDLVHIMAEGKLLFSFKKKDERAAYGILTELYEKSKINVGEYISHCVGHYINDTDWVEGFLNESYLIEYNENKTDYF